MTMAGTLDCVVRRGYGATASYGYDPARGWMTGAAVVAQGLSPLPPGPETGLQYLYAFDPHLGRFLSTFGGQTIHWMACCSASPIWRSYPGKRRSRARVPEMA